MYSKLKLRVGINNMCYEFLTIILMVRVLHFKLAVCRYCTPALTMILKLCIVNKSSGFAFTNYLMSLLLSVFEWGFLISELSILLMSAVSS
jgi:hypothetical protein